MKTKTLKAPAPVRDTRPLNGFTSCLPPVRARPPQRKTQEPARAIGEGLLRVHGPIRVLEVVDVDQYDDEYYDEQFNVAPGADADERSTRALDNLSDAELRALEPIVEALKAHDWTYDFSDDGGVWRRGRAQRERIDAMLSAIPKDQARALWAMYAPAVLGAWRAL